MQNTYVQTSTWHPLILQSVLQSQWTRIAMALHVPFWAWLLLMLGYPRRLRRPRAAINGFSISHYCTLIHLVDSRANDGPTIVEALYLRR